MSADGVLYLAPVPVWTGRIDAWASLYPGPGPGATPRTVVRPRVLLDVSVRLDCVTFWAGSRTLAVVDRDQFRAWFRRPFTPMARDDVQFTVVDRQLCLLIDGTGPYALNAGAVAQLAQVL